MPRKMTQMQEQTYTEIKKFGNEGIDADGLAATMGLSKASVYRYLNFLFENNFVSKKNSRVGNRVMYTAGGKSRMPVMPGMGAIIPTIPVANYLVQWKTLTDVDDWKHLQAIRQFPYLLAEVARFAHRWESTEPGMRPQKDEVDTVRKALLNIIQRANHIKDMASSVIEDPRYWDKVDAKFIWFEDEQVPFSPAALAEIYQHIKEITR